MNESSTSRQFQPLPLNWVQKIFNEMHGHYGSRFLNMWTNGQLLPDGSGDAGLANAMRCWAEKLGGFSEHPESLKYALSKLPAEPPTLPQFLEMCRHAPRKDAPMLEHKFTAEEIERNKQRAREAIEMLAKKKSINNGDNHVD